MTFNVSRRSFLATAAAGATASGAFRPAQDAPALIGITLDLEMSRNFPQWETTHWDYEKGNLNRETKAYAVEACRRVKQRGGVLHCFAVGRVLEQEDVSWLKGIAKAGHPIGNHTYDHVNVMATKPAQVQFRFARAPWLLRGRKPADVIRDNIRLANTALRQRAGIQARGFRTPGGFYRGLSDRPDVRTMLSREGFTWVSSKYPRHLMGKPGAPPSAAVLDSIEEAQGAAQPFRYPDGLVEIPMSPISDIGAFRNGRWKLDHFLAAIERAVKWTIKRGGVFDFLGHPSCLYVTDPKFRTIDLICDLVERAGERAVPICAPAARARRA